MSTAALEEPRPSAVSEQKQNRLQQEEMISLILKGTQPSDQMGVGSRLTGSMFTTEMLKVLSDSRKG